MCTLTRNRLYSKLKIFKPEKKCRLIIEVYPVSIMPGVSCNYFSLQEENYLRLELHSLQDQEPSYFYDLWNWFDWVTYFILLIQLIMHVVDILFHHSTLTDVQRGTFSVAIILIWVRLMKNFRAFRQVGPFIVICTYMIKDIFRWLFVYLIFYIPYCKLKSRQ